ncbi:hypothetical protein BDA96_02G251100 [Sorghum bicolor]|uniref:25S rRNA (uridine-N(3))-methyltransferase BMT5-like domain-containing protein n=2 Tax=Sorghum bicolor TaxID=4558 RepID=A0A921RQP0_SORBI|nr:hypothetical protein BDA96_02G251100 [Sorghum bicolor]OQU89668.1 hypothetical protein SORBI_3002G239800 [Sorghum bicolor]
MAVATSPAAGGNGEGVPLPAGVAATAANGRQEGDMAEGVLVVGSMAPRAEGVPVIDLTAVAEEEEEEKKKKKKKDHSTDYEQRQSRIDLTALAEEVGDDEKEGQGVDGPSAEGVPVIDLTEVSSDEEEEVRWVGQYSSTQSILLVGDGDFSFSLALATGFGSGANLVATSLDSCDTLKKKYSGAESNLAELRKMGAVTLHGVNAKTMKLHTDLKMRRFDRVIFNFPHAGFKGKEDQPHMIKKLVKDFFCSASLLLRPDGEVHVSHKTKNPYRKWNLEELASVYALFLVEQVDFRIQDYPGYSNKRGDGLQCDQPFLLGNL